MLARLLLAAAVATSLLLPVAGRAQELLVVANPSVEVPAPLSLGQLAAIYLLRITRWPDGSHIVPVNREATSGVRALFTERVLRQSNASLAAYWNEMHFKGRLPPVVQESEQAVLAFVRKVPGAIGYVGAVGDPPVPPAGVKVLARVR
ncbi:PBP superfamily domain-containing protein [Tistlia consotensis]|uniref:PBP superfamily domain-containing protein n=1 Tax=Tistlia consotensis USBA 355 TaxID=560819 RepID=A0A1Y6CKR4_9PROT|nr:substrate-binding domain-containing protein [Tistlia consotensis]SMF60104.1 PBP superfamily domain-containing protein [Tistlia consotensis USBA 355]SNR93858.1 PBP superfamily domain-containing protein [Tistlia consotensis]